MGNPKGTGLMAVFAVSGSVVFVAMQIHKRLLSSFMKKMEYELIKYSTTGAMKEVVKKKKKKKVRFADEMAEVVAEKRQAVASRQNYDENFDEMPLNWQVLYKGILKHKNFRG